MLQVISRRLLHGFVECLETDDPEEEEEELQQIQAQGELLSVKLQFFQSFFQHYLPDTSVLFCFNLSRDNRSMFSIVLPQCPTMAECTNKLTLTINSYTLRTLRVTANLS